MGVSNSVPLQTLILKLALYIQQITFSKLALGGAEEALSEQSSEWVCTIDLHIVITRIQSQNHGRMVKLPFW